MDFKGASEYIVQRLNSELSPSLFYHTPGHSLDVLTAIRKLGETEDIDDHARILLDTAALFHDAGMLVQYHDHEAFSVTLCHEILSGFGYSDTELDQISSLILVTRLPQHPANILEQIICDADLDYLGRDDYFINSFKLRLEWQVNGIRNTTLNEWFDLQVKFLSEHHYFTKSAFNLRNAKKMANLAELRTIVNNSGPQL